MTTKDLILSNISEAVKISQEKGFKIGAVVAHPSDSMAYEIKDITDKKIAIVWYNKNTNTIKEYPLCEMFDPNILYELCMKEKAYEFIDNLNKEIKESVN